MQVPVKELLESIDDAMQPQIHRPGYTARASEVAKPITLAPWFLDRCRRAYLSLSFEGDSRILGITSAFRGEGRTTVAIGVANALAADTLEQTLLLECDVERPALARIYNLEPGSGFSGWLEGVQSPRVVRMPYLPHLVALPAGSPHPDPARLLYQMSENNVIGELTVRFKNIVIDLPSVLDVAYSSLATRLADKLLVVARYGATQLTDLEKLYFLLGQERISGVVMNATNYKTPGWLRRFL